MVIALMMVMTMMVKMAMMMMMMITYHQGDIRPQGDFRLGVRGRNWRDWRSER